MPSGEKCCDVPKNKNLTPNGTCLAVSSGLDEFEAIKTKDSIRRYAPGQRITLGILALTNFCSTSCESLQPLLFPREAESKGITATQYGLIFGAFYISVFVGALIVGKLVAHRPPKHILIAGVFVVGVTYLLLGTLELAPSGTPFLALAFAVRIVEGLGYAAVRTSAFTILVSQFRESTSTNVGLLELCRGLGYVVAPTVGGSLFDITGFGPPFYVMGSLELCNLVIIFFFLPASEKSGKKETNFLKFWFSPGTMIYFPVVVSTLIYSAFNNANLEPHLRQFNLSGSALGLIYALLGFSFALGSGICGWLCDKKLGNKTIIFIASGLIVVAEILVGPLPFFKTEPILGFIIFAQFLTGFGSGGKLICSFSGALEDAVSQGFPRNLNTFGLVSSAFITAEAFGASAGPSLGGLLVDKFGYRTATVVTLTIEILLIVTLSVYVCSRKSDRASSQNVEKTPLLASNCRQPPSYC